jgi:hypothetical protein
MELEKKTAMASGKKKKKKLTSPSSLSLPNLAPLKQTDSQARSRRRHRKLQRQAWNPPLSHPLLRKAELMHARACEEASTSTLHVDADCCFLEQLQRPSQAKRAAAAAAAASAVLANEEFPPAARARVAARWFAGAYAGVEPSLSTSAGKTMTIANGEKKEAAVSKKPAAAKPAAALAAKPKSRPASASSRRGGGGKRPASARSSRRPVSSSGSRA